MPGQRKYHCPFDDHPVSKWCPSPPGLILLPSTEFNVGFPSTLSIYFQGTSRPTYVSVQLNGCSICPSANKLQGTWSTAQEPCGQRAWTDCEEWSCEEVVMGGLVPCWERAVQGKAEHTATQVHACELQDLDDETRVYWAQGSRALQMDAQAWTDQIC